jgi:DNA-binding IclR family transcriptional regulator
MDPQEVGTAGGEAEKQAIADGKIAYGKGKATVAVVQPLRDRNGEPIAAVRVTMKSFPGQTEQSALQRALPIVKEMQARVRTLSELKD